MDPFVFAAVLAAAAMHAGWNAILKIRLEPFLAMTLVMAAGTVLGLPMLAVFGWPRLEAWPWVIASVILHIGYALALTEAYARADMGQVYPIARGSAPLLTALMSVFLLCEPIALGAVAGIVLLATGIGLIALRSGRNATRLDPAALGFALLTACIIASYTVVDGTGARRAGDPHAYTAALFVLEGIAVVAVALVRRGRVAVLQTLPFAGVGLAGGAMAVGAYWIAIWAMTVEPIAIVAALRETSVLFAALIAIVILKEPLNWLRIVAAIMVLGGLVLIRLQS